MSTVERAQRLFDNGFSFPPISFLLVRLAINAWGISEWSTRFFPALIGVLTIPVLYFPIRGMFDDKAALVASLLLSISPWHLYWSQNARFYTALLLFFTLALYLLYLGLERGRPWLLPVSLIFVILAARERDTALFFLPIAAGYIALFIFKRYRKSKQFRWGRIVLAGFLAIVIILYFSRHVWIDPLALLNLSEGRINNNPFWIGAGVVYYLGVPIVCMGLLGIVYLWLKQDHSVILLGLGAIVPLVATMILSMFMYTANRYVFISLTSWILLAAVGGREILAHTQGKARILAAAPLLILLLEPLSEDVLYFTYQHGNRGNWQAAIQYIKEGKQPDDLVVVSNARIGDYYLGMDTIYWSDIDLDLVESGDARVWFVEDLTAVEEFPPETLNWVQNHARLVANFDVSVRARNFIMRVYLYNPVGQ